MLKLYVSVLIFLLTNLLIAQQNDMKDKLEELKKEFAPDKRTAVFDYSITDSSKIIQVTTDKADAVKELGKLRSEFGTYKLNIKFLPDEELGEQVYGLINVSVANIRSEPKHSAEMATQALLGTQIKILDKSNGWYRVQTPDEYIAWTEEDSFVRMNFQELDMWKSAKKIIFLSEFGFAYDKPDLNSGHVSDLVAGNILRVLGEENNFYKVQYPDGRIAFVPKEQAEDYSLWLASTNPTQERIVKTALRFLGIPYLWGGTSAKGMDCSGFTKTVYLLNGVLLARDASQQVLYGEPVNTKNGFENLQPGDLLFFGRKKNNGQKEKVTHVGIYIGNGEFIHASGRVKINSLDPKASNFNEYRYKTFIRAKRILTSLNNKGIITVNNSQAYSE